MASSSESRFKPAGGGVPMIKGDKGKGGGGHRGNGLTLILK